MNSTIRDSELIILIAVGILVMVLFAVSLVIMFLIAQRRILNEKMSKQSLEIQHREELLQTNILVQENERSRIAKDLHDDIGSKLNIIHLNLHQLRKFGKGKEDVQAVIKDIYALIHLTINTTRRISHDLLPPTLKDFGLVEAIRELFDSFGNGDIDMVLEVSNNNRTEGHHLLELNLFRVVQELINNSIKHGNANTIKLEVAVHDKEVVLNYFDNGVGFDSSNLKSKKGLGLKNIDSRLSMVNGKISYVSEVGKGVEAVVSCPIPQQISES